ncbi:unnamed protein product [marine sediment metagenome]|uniref:Uncharacterized protein n=1 Tax=marine sediment metagenome TaxID=412755 RepID=X1AR03_9ZZZZ
MVVMDWTYISIGLVAFLFMAWVIWEARKEGLRQGWTGQK